MKELLKHYVAYNTWATQRLLDVILALPEEKQMMEIVSSYSSLFKTVFHMWDAESIWWQRLKFQEHITRPSENGTASMQDVAAGLLQQSRQWEEWVNNASDLSLEHVFQYQNTKREMFKMPVFQMVHHVCNHATYHRGQLITILRQVGVEKLPSTDFTLWIRSKK